VPCAQGLAIIGQLYRIERAASDRQRESVPGLLSKRGGDTSPGNLPHLSRSDSAAALPKSPLAAALGYALRNWTALTRYTEDGRLKIDNNGAGAGATADRELGFIVLHLLKYLEL
jgi:transposase